MDNLQKMKVFYVRALLAMASGNPMPDGVTAAEHAKNLSDLAWELAEQANSMNCTDFIQVGDSCPTSTSSN